MAPALGLGALLAALSGGCASQPHPVAPSVAERQATARKNYEVHCASCHGSGRTGLTAPGFQAAAPESLERLKKKDAVRVIMEGRPSTQMKGFGDQLGPQDAEELAELLYRPLPAPPVWGLEQIRSSSLLTPVDRESARPIFKADPLNLFFVVELGHGEAFGKQRRRWAGLADPDTTERHGHHSSDSRSAASFSS
jgi:mono/diheme cytochrome c family protein